MSINNYILIQHGVDTNSKHTIEYKLICRNGFASLINSATASLNNHLRKYAYCKLGFAHDLIDGDTDAPGFSTTNLALTAAKNWRRGGDNTDGSQVAGDFATGVFPSPNDVLDKTFIVSTSAGTKKIVLVNWDIETGEAVIKVDEDTSVLEPIVHPSAYSEVLMLDMATGDDIVTISQEAVGNMESSAQVAEGSFVRDIFINFDWSVTDALTNANLENYNSNDKFLIVSSAMINDSVNESGIIGKFVSWRQLDNNELEEAGLEKAIQLRFNILESQISAVLGGNTPNLSTTLIKKLPSVELTDILKDGARSFLLTLKDSFGDTWNNGNITDASAVPTNVRITQIIEDGSNIDLSSNDIEGGGNLIDLVIRKGQVAPRHRADFAIGAYDNTRTKYSVENYVSGINFHNIDPGHGTPIVNPEVGGTFYAEGTDDFEAASKSVCYVIQLAEGNYEFEIINTDLQEHEISMDIHEIVNSTYGSLKYRTTISKATQDAPLEFFVGDNEGNPPDLDFYTIMNDPAEAANSINGYQHSENNSIGTGSKINTLRIAQFLMKEDHSSGDNNSIILGNANSYGFLRLLETLVKHYDSDMVVGLDTNPSEIHINDHKSSLRNVIIIKEEFFGKINREPRRLTENDGTILDFEFNINSILHVIYDGKVGQTGSSSKSNVVIKILEDTSVISFKGNDLLSNSEQHIDEEIILNNDVKYFSNGTFNKFHYKQSYNDPNLAVSVDLASHSSLKTGISAPRIPILRLNWEEHLDKISTLNSDPLTKLTTADWGELAHEVLKTHLTDSSTSEMYEVEWVITRDELESLDDLPITDGDTGTTNKGENYIIVIKCEDSIGVTQTFNSRIKRISFVPILNELLTVYYNVGQAIRKSDISDTVYYRDAFGYVSPYNRGEFLNRSLHYFIEKDVSVRTFNVNAENIYVDDGTSNMVNSTNPTIKIEKRKYRFYLDFVETLPEFDYNYDNKIYDNNIVPLGITLNNLINVDYNESSWYPSNTQQNTGNSNTSIQKVSHFEVRVNFSANSSTNDIYQMLIDNEDLYKTISATGEIAMHYDIIIDNIQKTLVRLYGFKDYDTEIYLSSIVVNNMIDGTSTIIRPADAPLQRIVIASDGTTVGASAVVIDSTIYLDNSASNNMGVQLSSAINIINNRNIDGPVRILTEEKMGYKINRLSLLSDRNKLTFNSSLVVHLGESIIKRIVIRERLVDDIKMINDDDRESDQELSLTTTNSSLSVLHNSRFDYIKILGGDPIEIDPSLTKTWDYTESVNGDGQVVRVLRHLVTRKHFMNILNTRDYDNIYILNNRKRLNAYIEPEPDHNTPEGSGIFKLAFTRIINKVLSIYYPSGEQLKMAKSSLQKRIYYLDSLTNDYVSDLQSNSGNFNIEGRYFIETVVDNVTYRLRLQFMESPIIYNSSNEIDFKEGMFLQTNTKLVHVFNLNLNVSFSHDKTNNDLYTLRIPQKYLINSVNQEGKILVSYANIVRNVEQNMKDTYGNSYYDRSMYLWNVSTGIDTLYSIAGNESACLLNVSPLEYTCEEVVVVDLDAQTLERVDGILTDKWDFSVTSYGHFISGEYNLERDVVDVHLDLPVLWNSAILFDERNPDHRFKIVQRVNTVDDTLLDDIEVACGNVDETSLNNVARKVTLLKQDGVSPVPVAGELDIIPKYLLNRVYTELSGTIDNKFTTIATGIKDGDDVEFKLDLDSSSSTDSSTNNNNNLQVLLKKIISAGIFTRFNHFPMIELLGGTSMVQGTTTSASSMSAAAQFKLVLGNQLNLLDTGGEKSTQVSKLFKYYNQLGKLDEDLDKNTQYPMDGSERDESFSMDLDNFKINVLGKFKGAITSSGSTEVPPNEDNLKKLLNDFFPNSNAFLHNSKLNYETVVKFQFINKALVPTTDGNDE